MVTYGFYNAINHDRRYDAEQMSSLFDGIIRDGVFMTVGNTFKVEAATGMTVTVDTGRAWFNRTWTDNDSKLPLVVDPSEVYLKRVDAVVLEVNTNIDVRANTIKIVKGSPASSPLAPTMVNADKVHQYLLATIFIDAGVTSIIASNIVNKVGTGSTPFVTGPLETVNVNFLYSQWEAEFTTWFENVQSQLEGDIATNLQNQINQTNANLANKVTRFPNKQAPYDLNTIVTEGIHELQGVATNTPYDEWGITDQHFWVKVFRHHSVEGYLHQQIIDVRGNRTFERSLVTGVWSAWLPTTGMDIGDIHTGVASPYMPGWMPCNGAILPYWQYTDLDAKIGGSYRVPFSRAIYPGVQLYNASYGRCVLNMSNNFMFVLQTVYGPKLYNYVKNTGAVTEVATGGTNGYTLLKPVFESGYGVYIKRTQNSSAFKVHIISPTGAVGPEISATAQHDQVHENCWGAYLKSPNEIELLYIFGTYAVRYTLNVISNAISTRVISGAPSAYVSMVWVLKSTVRYFLNDGTYWYMPREFSNFSEAAPISGSVKSTGQDASGNGLITSGRAAYLLRYDETHVSYPIFLEAGEVNYVSASNGFYWNKARGYGVLMLIHGGTGSKSMLFFNEQGVISRSGDLAGAYFDGEMGMFFTQSPWTVILGYVGRDIRLPNIADNNGLPYAAIRVK